MALKMVDTKNIMTALGMKDVIPVLTKHKVQIAFSLKGVVVYNSDKVVKVSLDNDLVKQLIKDDSSSMVSEHEVSVNMTALFKGLREFIPVKELAGAMSEKMTDTIEATKAAVNPFEPKEFSKKFDAVPIVDDSDVIGEYLPAEEPKGVKAKIKKVDPVMIKEVEPVSVSMKSKKAWESDKDKLYFYKKAYGMSDVLEGFKADKVPLKNATALFQPVGSTSAGSTYHVVALSDGLKIAARYKGTSLSVRAEGDLKKYKNRLLEVGFSMSGDSHASFHVGADGILWKKAIGSVVMGLGLDFSTVTNLEALKGKGE